MSRDQRADHNRALSFAAELARENAKPLCVVLTLVTDYSGGVLRHYRFMFDGLKEVEYRCRQLEYGFKLLLGNPAETLPEFLKETNAFALVADFDPLKIKRIWKRDVAKKITVPFYEVDAHNVVPCLIASQKCEFGAYTLRPKIHKLLPEFSEPVEEAFPVGITFKYASSLTDWDTLLEQLPLNRDVAPVTHIQAGNTNALTALETFLTQRLNGYAEKRNDPVIEGQSVLSPFIHFGHLSAEHIYQQVKKYSSQTADTDAFLEELIIRRELADNFCYYNTAYDSFSGFHPWAQTTLNEHRDDKRDFVYSLNEFETALTHDELWNAAQKQMVHTGKMHGFMRMYWAKKILEWSESPEEALRIALFLNDKYELDGRDPNGFTGCAWSIGGVHDRAWTERPVYGKIRYMNYNGCKRKFDVAAYIKNNTY